MSQFLANIVLSIAWASLGVVLLFLATLAFDALHPLHLRRSIEEGNLAAGILLGAVTIGMAIIISTAIS